MALTEKEKREFGERFCQALEHAGLITLNHKELGKKLGDVSDATVSNWKNGIKLPSMAHGIIIAKVTKVALEWLMTGRGKMLEGRRATPEAEALLLLYEQSAPDVQAQILLTAAHQAWLLGDHEKAQELQEMAESMRKKD